MSARNSAENKRLRRGQREEEAAREPAGPVDSFNREQRRRWAKVQRRLH